MSCPRIHELSAAPERRRHRTACPRAHGMPDASRRPRSSPNGQRGATATPGRASGPRRGGRYSGAPRGQIAPERATAALQTIGPSVCTLCAPRLHAGERVDVGRARRRGGRHCMGCSGLHGVFDRRRHVSPLASGATRAPRSHGRAVRHGAIFGHVPTGGRHGGASGQRAYFGRAPLRLGAGVAAAAHLPADVSTRGPSARLWVSARVVGPRAPTVARVVASSASATSTGASCAARAACCHGGRRGAASGQTRAVGAAPTNAPRGARLDGRRSSVRPSDAIAPILARLAPHTGGGVAPGPHARRLAPSRTSDTADRGGADLFRTVDPHRVLPRFALVVPTAARP